MKKIIFLFGLVILSMGVYGQKVSTLVTRGDTIEELTGNEYISFAELDGSPSTKAIRLQTLIQALEIFNDSIRGALADSIWAPDVITFKYDTINKLSFAFTDSSQFILNRKYMLKKHSGLDTLNITEISVQVPTGTPNFAYNIYIATDGSATGTKLFTTDPVVTGSDATSTGEIDIPNNGVIPPDRWIWIQFSDLTAKPPTGAAFTLDG